MGKSTGVTACDQNIYELCLQALRDDKSVNEVRKTIKWTKNGVPSKAPAAKTIKTWAKKAGITLKGETASVSTSFLDGSGPNPYESIDVNDIVKKPTLIETNGQMFRWIKNDRANVGILKFPNLEKKGYSFFYRVSEIEKVLFFSYKLPKKKGAKKVGKIEYGNIMKALGKKNDDVLWKDELQEINSQEKYGITEEFGGTVAVPSNYVLSKAKIEKKANSIYIEIPVISKSEQKFGEGEEMMEIASETGFVEETEGND